MLKYYALLQIASSVVSAAEIKIEGKNVVDDISGETTLRIGQQDACLNNNLPTKDDPEPYKYVELEKAKASSRYATFSAEKAIDGNEDTMWVSKEEEGDTWEASFVGGKTTVTDVMVKSAGNKQINKAKIEIGDTECGSLPDETDQNKWYTVTCKAPTDGNKIKITDTTKENHMSLYAVKVKSNEEKIAMLPECKDAGTVLFTKEKLIKFKDGGKCLGLKATDSTPEIQDCKEEKIMQWEPIYQANGLVKIQDATDPKKLLYVEKVDKDYQLKFGDATDKWSEWQVNWNFQDLKQKHSDLKEKNDYVQDKIDTVEVSLKNCKTYKDVCDDVTKNIEKNDKALKDDNAQVEEDAKWMKVRYVPAGTKWHTATDRLKGTEVYGKAFVEDEAWSIKFDDIPFTNYKFESVDQKQMLQISKYELFQKREFSDCTKISSDSLREAIKSSSSEKSYNIRYCNRKDVKSDPIIYMQDYQDLKDGGTYKAIYNGGSSELVDDIGIVKDNEGVNVFIDKAQFEKECKVKPKNECEPRLKEFNTVTCVEKTDKITKERTEEQTKCKETIDKCDEDKKTANTKCDEKTKKAKDYETKQVEARDKCIEQEKKCQTTKTDNEKECKAAAGKCAEDATKAKDKCKTDGADCKTLKEKQTEDADKCTQEKKLCLRNRSSNKLNSCERDNENCIEDTSDAKLQNIEDEASSKECAKNLESTTKEKVTLSKGGDICPAKLEDFQTAMTKAASKYETVQKSFDLILEEMKATQTQKLATIKKLSEQCETDKGDLNTKISDARAENGKTKEAATKEKDELQGSLDNAQKERDEQKEKVEAANKEHDSLKEELKKIQDEIEKLTK